MKPDAAWTRSVLRPWPSGRPRVSGVAGCGIDDFKKPMSSKLGMHHRINWLGEDAGRQSCVADLRLGESTDLIGL